MALFRPVEVEGHRFPSLVPVGLSSSGKTTRGREEHIFPVWHNLGRQSLLEEHIIPDLDGPGKANHKIVRETFLADSPGPVLGRGGQPQKSECTFPGLKGSGEPISIRGVQFP